MPNPLTLVLKLQFDLLRNWCALTGSLLQLYGGGSQPVPVRSRGTSLVPPGHPTMRR